MDDRSRRTVPSLDQIRQNLLPLLKEGDATKAVVFGSYARGDADEHSDLDLIIIAETDRRFLERHKDFLGVLDAWGGGIDVLVYTPAEFSDMVAHHNPFIERALAEGVVIYEEQRGGGTKMAAPG